MTVGRQTVWEASFCSTVKTTECKARKLLECMGTERGLLAEVAFLACPRRLDSQGGPAAHALSFCWTNDLKTSQHIKKQAPVAQDWVSSGPGTKQQLSTLPTYERR